MFQLCLFCIPSFMFCLYLIMLQDKIDLEKKIKVKYSSSDKWKYKFDKKILYSVKMNTELLIHLIIYLFIKDKSLVISFRPNFHLNYKSVKKENVGNIHFFI